MKIVVSANSADLDGPSSPVFGRCPMYVFVDTETMVFEAVENPAIAAVGGAGIQAAQFVVERGAQTVVSGNVGPNAFNVFQAAGVPVFTFGGGTVRQAVEAYLNRQLSVSRGATTQAHAGMGMGRGTGRGAAMPTTPPAPSTATADARGEEIAALKERAGDLRQWLAEVTERLDRLEQRR